MTGGFYVLLDEAERLGPEAVVVLVPFLILVRFIGFPGEFEDTVEGGSLVVRRLNTLDVGTGGFVHSLGALFIVNLGSRTRIGEAGVFHGDGFPGVDTRIGEIGHRTLGGKRK